MKTSSGYKRQPVRIGAFNNDFIELQEGVDAGDKVFLKMPDSYEPAKVQNSRIARDAREREAEAEAKAEAKAKAKAEAGKVDKTASTAGETEEAVESDEKA
jgi:predicted  nucleic acid-binding Zn-ribbon protein